MEVLSNLMSNNSSAFPLKISRWTPAGNGTAITADGALGLAITGTATAANVDVTNIHTALRRIEYLVTAAATNAVAGFRISVGSQFWRGNASGLGGFSYLCQWGPATGVATSTARAFVGMSALTTQPTDVNPSTLLTMIGMGWDATDANIQLMHNDGAGTATKIDLGASFPVPVDDRTKAYELQLFCEPNASSILYKVTDLGTGSFSSGSVNSDIPSNTDLLSPRGWMSVGGTSSVIGIALMNMWIETEK